MNTTHYANKTVVVTGAGGSIGSEICKRLLPHVAELRLVSLTEQKLYDVERFLRTLNAQDDVPPKLVPILGSVTNERLMAQVCEGADIVIHAAAHKHVPLCEENPLEAITNNLGGTMTLMDQAALQRVEQFVLVSTDKAVKPVSIMGATKRACELYADYRRPRSPMDITTVRFGNVLNSAGSVLPLWREQIAKGLPITLTDARCERFFMSIEDAVELTLGAASLPGPNGLFVLDMGKPQSLYRMALELVCEYINERDGCPDMLDPNEYIKYIGLRPGEKLTEELDYGGERVPTVLPKVFRVKEPARTVPPFLDFQYAVYAACARAKTDALNKLWSIVR